MIRVRVAIHSISKLRKSCRPNLCKTRSSAIAEGPRDANRNAYAIYRMALFPMTLSDPDYPKPPYIFHILYRLSGS